ncbi:hypothetical protein FPHYL_8668 [Fusarium phyllophilum]|uniref:Uncharacterized protein n=1 Tax=Fusarium phyllophilum TaxID=47803 RepID=A0A8H5JFD3_9HYPO|nr:hypothetical protein FPHYL_8668 [Fusarium phyllophilum]
MADNNSRKRNIATRGPEEMSETVSKNKLSLQGEPEGDNSGSEPRQSGKDGSAEEKPTEETKTKAEKKVRFKDDPQEMDSKDKKSRNGDNPKNSAPTSYRFSLWDGETIKEMNNCLIKAKADLKRVETRVKELEDKKKALLQEREDLQTEIAMFKRSIKKKRSLALFVGLP